MSFLKGLKDGSPIGLGYFAVSFSFGIAGAKVLTWPLVTLISMTNLTSAGQFAGLQIMADAAGTLVEMAIASFFINLRYSLMAISLSQKVDANFGTGKRLLLATGITDEIYAVSMSQDGKVSARYFLGLSTLPYVGWALGTLTGGICGEILPAMVTNALGVALYGMFIAIVVPPMKGSRPTCVAVAIAIALSLSFRYVPALSGVTVGFAIIICAVVASLVCAFFFPMRESGDDSHEEAA
ncbi:MAG: AzlC family ABC transporter permease [Fibrobacter sp.]|nr:AzlC family ABC transporter permease [Fibrobacter sp.]